MNARRLIRDLVGAGKKSWRQNEVDAFGGLEINNKLEVSGLSRYESHTAMTKPDPARG